MCLNPVSGPKLGAFYPTRKITRREFLEKQTFEVSKADNLDKSPLPPAPKGTTKIFGFFWLANVNHVYTKLEEFRSKNITFILIELIIRS